MSLITLLMETLPPAHIHSHTALFTALACTHKHTIMVLTVLLADGHAGVRRAHVREHEGRDDLARKAREVLVIPVRGGSSEMEKDDGWGRQVHEHTDHAGSEWLYIRRL